MSSAENVSYLDTSEEFDRLAYGNYIAATYLWPFMPPIFLCIGTICNTMSIVIFTRPEMRKYSSFVYFAFLNIVNIGALYTNCIRGIMDFNFGVDIRSQNLFICKFHVFLTYFLCHLSSQILSTISVDRVISVMFLRLSKTICVPKIAVRVTLCIAIFNFMLSSHFLFLESGYTEVQNVTSSENNMTSQIEVVVCDIRPNNLKYNYFVQYIWKLIDMSMFTFIPFLIMLASSIIIIVRIAQQSKKLGNHDKNKKDSKGHAKQDNRFNARTRNLALMLIPVNIMFLIFVGPVVIAIYTYSDLGRDHLALVTVEVLSNCNFTLNFFIYFATSSKFREEFYKLFDEITSKLKTKSDRNGKNFMTNTTGSQTKRLKIKKKMGENCKLETVPLNKVET